MPATVYFVTNRVVAPPGDRVACYSDDTLPSPSPAGLTYGRAFVDDANFATDAIGTVTSIDCLRQGGFDAEVSADLRAPGRNLLVFVHGFANSFADALTRSTFNQQWFAQAAGGASTIVAFNWPSLGRVLINPSLDAAYKRDQKVAAASAAHVGGFLAAFAPIAAAARGSGVRVNLLAHSMGNWVLAGAVQSWFEAGGAPAHLFDTAVLAAADEPWDSFGQPVPARLSRLRDVAARVVVCHSIADQVLEVSSIINGVQRMGLTGPREANDPAVCPPNCVSLIDCAAFRDYPRDLASSHQYYRRSPSARDAIAGVF